MIETGRALSRNARLRPYGKRAAGGPGREGAWLRPGGRGDGGPCGRRGRRTWPRRGRRRHDVDRLIGRASPRGLPLRPFQGRADAALGGQACSACASPCCARARRADAERPSSRATDSVMAVRPVDCAMIRFAQDARLRGRGLKRLALVGLDELIVGPDCRGRSGLRRRCAADGGLRQRRGGEHQRKDDGGDGFHDVLLTASPGPEERGTSAVSREIIFTQRPERKCKTRRIRRSGTLGRRPPALRPGSPWGRRGTPWNVARRGEGEA